MTGSTTVATESRLTLAKAVPTQADIDSFWEKTIVQPGYYQQYGSSHAIFFKNCGSRFNYAMMVQDHRVKRDHENRIINPEGTIDICRASKDCLYASSAVLEDLKTWVCLYALCE